MDLNRDKSVIYGLAIGDAMGRLAESKSLSKMKSEYGKKASQACRNGSVYLQFLKRNSEKCYFHFQSWRKSIYESEGILNYEHNFVSRPIGK